MEALNGNDEQNPVLEAAIEYATKRGWHLIPLQPRKPIPRFTEYFKKASNSVETVIEWWTKNPTDNIGIVTGSRSSLVVLDIDCHTPEANGKEQLGLWLEEKGLSLPKTLRVKTGSPDSSHYYFYAPLGEGRIKSRVGMLLGIDLIADKKFVVGVPSIHQNGNTYRWKTDSNAPLALLPDWLALAGIDSPTIEEVVMANQTIGEGSRNIVLTRIAGALRARGYDYEQLLGALIIVNLNRCVPTLEDAELVGIAKSIASRPVNIKSEEVKMNAIERMLGEHQLITGPEGNTYEFKSCCWESISDNKIKQLAIKYGGYDFRYSKAALDYAKALSSMDEIPWRNIEKTEIPFANGVYDFATGVFREHRTTDYLEAVLPHAFVLEADCPVWKQCLVTFFGDNSSGLSEAAALQEFFGYCLMQHAQYKKALICIGKANTGKTVVQNLLVSLIGQSNCCELPVNKMGSARARACIKGKLLNTVGELCGQSKLHDSGFKKLVSTEEPVSIDAKWMQPEFYIPIAKHAFFTNVMPEIDDSSGAVFERLLIIGFNNVIPKEKQVRELGDNLKREAAGIILWAIEGAKRLYANQGQFTEPESSLKLLNEYRMLTNPIQTFIDECFLAEEKVNTPTSTVYEAYCNWEKSNKKYARNNFTVALKNSGFIVERCAIDDGRRLNCLVGYKLISEDMPTWLPSHKDRPIFEWGT
jgi:P4 family phage/plasmid primase-like protien